MWILELDPLAKLCYTMRWIILEIYVSRYRKPRSSKKSKQGTNDELGYICIVSCAYPYTHDNQLCTLWCLINGGSK